MTETREQDVAEAFAAARLLHEQHERCVGGGAETRGARPSITASRILAYATGRTQVADMAIERVLRTEAGARALYLNALSGAAIAESPVALAASEAAIAERRIGEVTLRLATEAGVDWLILTLSETTSTVKALELRTREGDGLRLRLPAPVEGVVQLPMDPEFPELVSAAALLRDPQTLLYLL